MGTYQRESSDESDCNLVLAVESARDLVGEIRRLSESLDSQLKRSADIDAIISILREKKGKVDTLKQLAAGIGAQIRAFKESGALNGGAMADVPASGISEDASGGGPMIPTSIRNGLADLMAEFRELVDEEARIESLICGRGIRIRRRRKT